MFERFRAGRSRAEARPAAPAGTRLYAVGDIHGRSDLLRAMHGLILADAARRPTPRKLVVYLGDYVDRGNDSSGVIELLLNQPLPGFEHVHLRGNHEDILLTFLDDLSIGPNWLTYGGRETLESYGIAAPEAQAEPAELERAQLALHANLPRAHLDFLRALPLAHAEGGYFFVHAGIRPGVPLERQHQDDLLWIREEFLESQADFGCVVVHGHTITAAPEVRHNRIGVDTGAFFSDHLTCLVAEGGERSFLQT